MEFDEKDTEVIQLLTKLKNAEGGYPAEMMASRRQSYMKQLAGLGIGAGAGYGIKHVLKGSGGSSIPPIASTLLETALIVAIVAEAAAVAIVNREKVSDIFRTLASSPNVQEVSTSIEIPSPFAIPSTTSTVEIIETVTPVGTPSPELLYVTNSSAESSMGNNDATLQSNVTPTPHGNNGNQYGLTPKPDRTKEPGNGNNDPGNGDDPGKKDPKPKKDPKK